MASDFARFVIIGNGVAGTTCAELLRRGDPACQIDMFTDEPYTLYNRVALPPFLKGKIPEGRVFLKDHAWHEKMNIRLHLSCRIAAVDAQGKSVTDINGVSYPYDKLLVAPGGKPWPLEVPGAQGCANIFNFQYLDETKAIIAAAQPGKTAVVTGGSFISYELAEGFCERGLRTIWAIRGTHFLRRVISYEGGMLVDKIAKAHGVEMIYGDEVGEVLRANSAVRAVKLTNGVEYPADMIGVGLGLKMNTSVLDGTGVAVKRGIVVTERMETSIPDIFAAGDAAEFFDLWINKHNLMGTWDNAIGHGKVAAANMLGGKEVYSEIPEYTTGMFHQKMTAFGITPESEKNVERVHKVDMDHETYTELFFLEGRLVGGIMIGKVLSRRYYKNLILRREVIPASERQKLLAPPKTAPASVPSTGHSKAPTS